MRRLTLKVGGAGALLRTDRELVATPTQEQLEAAADAALEALTKRVDRKGASMRPALERVGPPTPTTED